MKLYNEISLLFDMFLFAYLNKVYWLGTYQVERIMSSWNFLQICTCRMLSLFTDVHCRHNSMTAWIDFLNKSLQSSSSFPYIIKQQQLMNIAFNELKKQSYWLYAIGHSIARLSYSGKQGYKKHPKLMKSKVFCHVMNILNIINQRIFKT